MARPLWVVLHGAIAGDASEDEQDVLVEVAQVGAALRQLGLEVTELSVGLDLGSAESRLAELAPEGVFNLVEAIAGDARLAPVGALLCERVGVRYTGASFDSLQLCSNKVHAKERMIAAGLSTPPWTTDGSALQAGSYILKSTWEHASVGIDDASVVAHHQVAPRLQQLGDRADWFAELFVAGRELNIALLERDGEPVMLPPAEILFQNFPPGKPRIVGYAAKWDVTSFEHANTVRSFPEPSSDPELFSRAEELARQTWQLFGLTGYARVDFRVSQAGEPFLLEVNPNPCLSEDAGFAAAATRAGLGYAELVGQIVRATARKGSA